MSASLPCDRHGDIKVVAGDKLVLRVSAHDPAGISKIFVHCFQFSLTTSIKLNLATGELILFPGEASNQSSFEINVHLPRNAALGKWGVRLIEFTNGRGYKTSFYRGQGKFDSIVFDVVPPPERPDEQLRLDGVEIADTTAAFDRAGLRLAAPSLQ